MRVAVSISVSLLPVLAMLACSRDDDRAAAKPPPTPAPVEPARAPTPAPADWGGCDLALGGAFDDRETVRASQRDAAKSIHWTNADDPSVPALAGNCMGKTIRVSFVAAPNVTVPFSPKTYTLAHGQGDLVIFARARDKQLVDISGTIDVTTFDRTHVAGTIELTASAGKARVTITGRFDFPCRGRSGCAR